MKKTYVQPQQKVGQIEAYEHLMALSNDTIDEEMPTEDNLDNQYIKQSFGWNTWD